MPGDGTSRGGPVASGAERVPPAGYDSPVPSRSNGPTRLFYRFRRDTTPPDGPPDPARPRYRLVDIRRRPESHDPEQTFAMIDQTGEEAECERTLLRMVHAYAVLRYGAGRFDLVRESDGRP